MEWQKRVLGMWDIIEESNENISPGKKDWQKVYATGFVPMGLSQIIERIKVIKENSLLPEGAVSLDLGCGIGGWALIAAAAGFNSYGIDVNPFVLDIARKDCERAVKEGFIEKSIDCRFAQGNIYPENYRQEYTKWAKENEVDIGEGRCTMPLDFSNDAYKEIGIEIGKADLVYSYIWPRSVPFQYSFFQKELKNGAIIALPWSIMHPLDVEDIGSKFGIRGPFHLAKKR